MPTYRANRYFDFVEVMSNGLTGGNPQTQFNFPDLPQIRTTPIFSIVVYTPNFMTASALTGSPLVALTVLKQAYLTLYTTDPYTGIEKNGINRIPLLELNYIEDNGSTSSPFVRNMPEFFGQMVTWPKSFITIPTPIGNVNNQVFCFGVRYGDPTQIQQ